MSRNSARYGVRAGAELNRQRVGDRATAVHLQGEVEPLRLDGLQKRWQPPRLRQLLGKARVARQLKEAVEVLRVMLDERFRPPQAEQHDPRRRESGAHRAEGGNGAQ
jgi:hypothetical protein